MIGERFNEMDSEPRKFGPWWSAHCRVINGRTFAFIRVKNGRGGVVAIWVAAADRPGYVHEFHH
jgi:hypothetical protein